MRPGLALALLLAACSETSTTNVYQAGVGGSAGNGGADTSAGGSAGEASTGGGSAASGAAGGHGGTAGEAGGGGDGGAPCEPQTCEDIHGACGVTDDGCGTPIDCEADCGGSPDDPWIYCGASGVCECNDAGSSAEAITICNGGGFPDAVAWCQATGCAPFYCGQPPKPLAPAECLYVADAAGGVAVWCCKG